MSQILFTTQKDRTPIEYADSSRPATMAEADKLYKKIQGNPAGDVNETLQFATKLSAIVKGTTSSTLNTLWQNIEGKLNDGKAIKTKSKTDEEKLQTAMGFFYSALDTIDVSSKNTGDLVALRDQYQAAKKVVEGRFLSAQTGKDQRMLQKVLDTLDKRFAKVVERFNTKVTNKEISGNKITLV